MKIYLTIIFSIFIASCSTSTEVIKPIVSQQNSINFNEYKYKLGKCTIQDEDATNATCDNLLTKLEYGFFSAGILYSEKDHVPYYELQISINQFRTVPTVNRYIVGMLAGPSSADINVKLVDAKTGIMKSEVKFSTSDFFAGSVQENARLQNLADEVVKYLTKKS